MVANANWRTRMESINIMSYLVKNSNASFMNEKIVKIILDYLKDRANSIRKEGVKLIIEVIDIHGQNLSLIHI